MVVKAVKISYGVGETELVIVTKKAIHARNSFPRAYFKQNAANPADF